MESMLIFSNRERLALLYLIIKVAASDKSISIEQQAKIKEFLYLNQLKLSDRFVHRVLALGYDDIIFTFSNSNLIRAYSIIKDFAKQNGINPEHKGKWWDKIKKSVEIAVASGYCAKLRLPPGVGILPDVRAGKRRKPVKLKEP
ncbi:hypothetical protein N9174_00955 [bacterium]|nr:hypothetical protein [bacterium]